MWLQIFALLKLHHSMVTKALVMFLRETPRLIHTVRNPTLSEYYSPNQSAQLELMGIDTLVYHTHTKQNTFFKATVNWWLGKLPVEENCDIHSAACLDSKWRSVLNLETTALTSAFTKTTCLAGIVSGRRGSSEDHKTRHKDWAREICGAVIGRQCGLTYWMWYLTTMCRQRLRTIFRLWDCRF